MTFSSFEKIVKDRYPTATVFRHGEFAGNKINVAVIFDDNSKVYKFNGTYVDVLNRLGIRACYRHFFADAVKTLEYLKKTNGEIGFFGEVIDNSREIADQEKIIQDLQQNYIIL